MEFFQCDQTIVICVTKHESGALQKLRRDQLQFSVTTSKR